MTSTVRNSRSFVLLGGILFLLVLSFSRVGHAAPVNNQGLTVSPAVLTVRLSQTESEKSNNVTVKNNYSVPVRLSAQIKGVDQDNGVLAPSLEPDESLSSSVSLNKTDFILAPNEETTIIVTVKNNAKLKPGGTYGSLVIKQVGISGSNVGIYPAIGAGLFITKEEGAIRTLGVTEFTYQRFLFNEPTSATITFKNTGNTHVIPRGQVLVTSKNLTAFYRKGVVNQESITLLPNKYIKLEVPLAKVANSFLPNRQKIMIQYRYEGTEQVQTIVKTILFVPIYIFLIIVVVLLAMVWFFRIVIQKRKIGNRKKEILPKKRIIVQDKAEGEKIPVHRL